MATPKDSMSAVLGVVILLLIVGVVIPPIAVSLDGEKRQTFTQTEGQEVTLTGALEAIPTNIDGGGSPGINVTIRNTNTDNSTATGFIPEFQTETVQLDGENVTVEATDVISSEEAIISYVYPLSLGLPDGVAVFLNNIVLLMVFLVFVSLAGTVFVIYEVGF